MSRSLLTALGNTVFTTVHRRKEEVDEVSEVLISPATATTILNDMILAGEREPYGVCGGVLIVTFIDRRGGATKMGRFPLDFTTYELNLNLVEDSNIRWRTW